MADQNKAPTTGCNDSSTKEIKETFVSKYGRLFLLVLSVFTFIFICLLYYANKEFRNSQKDIISCYGQHINHADSLYHNMVNYNERYVFNINELSTKVATDSIIKVALNSKKGVSKEQYNNLSKIITSYFDDMRQLHEQYDRKIRHDSLLICTEEQLLKGQTNKLLELHLNKVEHEYSNITIWAAVLTILFLVFSFYSIFKMDELVQQGHEGVRDIRKLTDKGEHIIKTIKNDGNTLLSDTRNKLATFTNDQQLMIAKTTEGLIKLANDGNNRIDEFIKKAYISIEEINKIREQSTELYKQQLEKINSDYDLKIIEKIQLLDTYIESIKALMEERDIQSQVNEEGEKNE
jgi:predicted PurR-regulated permease PerM